MFTCCTSKKIILTVSEPSPIKPENMINTTIVEVAPKFITNIKKELSNEINSNTCDYKIKDVSNTMIILSCSGKCNGHDNDILKICKDIKLVSQHIDVNSDTFYIKYHYYRRISFLCNFAWGDEGSYHLLDNNNDVGYDNLDILVEEGILRNKKGGQYVDSDRFPFCRKTSNGYCNSCEEHFRKFRFPN